MNKNPYVGPRSFELNEKMYGRDRERRQLTDRLIAERIVLLHSPSGAGKTSLVRAGLIPQLKDEGFFVHQIIRVNLEKSTELVKITDTLKNTQRFNRYTFSTLLSLEEQYPAEMHVDLDRLARMSLEEYLTFRSREDKRDGPEFLIFDQFEEVLTIDPTDRAAKNAFFAHVGTALKNRDRWALFVMRTDFVAALEPYVRAVPTYFSNTFHLELLGVKSSLEAIQKPAQDMGVDFTNSAAAKLVDDLRRIQVQQLDGSTASQLGLYIEPVQLQVVCYRLWESKAADDNDIDESDLANVGDVNQSLSEYYALSVAKAAQATSLPERSIREWFDRKLITPEGIRSQVRMGAEASDGLENAAVRQLENAHIIRAEKRAGQTWYELAHDRLIEPVRGDNQHWFDANLSLFQRQAVLWLEQGRSESLLLRGTEFETAEQQTGEISLTPEESDFLEACRTLRAREKRDRTQRRLILVGAVVSFVFFIAALFFGINAANANASLQNAKETADSAAFVAQVASTKAIEQQAIAEAASTKAYQSADQAATAEAIALDEKENAQKQAEIALTQKAIAYQAATQVSIEKANAEAEKAKADAQAKIAQSSELVAQSILANNQNKVDVSILLALEAYRMNDNPRTRIQLLSFIFGSLTLYQSPNLGITTHVGFNNDNTALMTANYDCKEDSLFVCLGGILRFWNTRSAGGVITQLTQGEIRKSGTIDALTVSPGRDIVATAFCNPDDNNNYWCDSEDIILWDAKTAARTGPQISITKDSANSRISNNVIVLMAFSPDNKMLAVALNKNTILLLDARTLDEIARLPLSYGGVQMAFSPDSKTLVFANGGRLILLDLARREKTEITAGSNANAVLSLAFSPDGRYFASGNADGSITLWDAGTFTKLDQTLRYDPAKVSSLAFSPDGKTLAAGYNDFIIILWDIETRQRLVRPLFRHTNIVYDLAFSADGMTLASVGNEIILWTTDPNQWVSRACRAAKRNLTQEEWKQYFPDKEYNLTCPDYPSGR
jgi:WD40 repeat protein